ncbi:MAG: DUF1330 domain-containing protein [Gemmatimonadaceae bacterium]
MSVFVVVQIDVTDPVAYETYKGLASPSIGVYDGRYVVRGGTTISLEGDWDPGRFVLLEFPSAERARAWHESPEYGAAKAARRDAANVKMILVEGPSYDPSAASA